MARRWVDLGAQRLHVVDLDGAREGHPVNGAIVQRIVREAGVPVQVSGGVRDADAVLRWIEAGASRVILGTLAVEQPDTLASILGKHGDTIAVALDVRAGRIATRGWIETSDAPAEEFALAMAAAGVAHLIYTDISRDGMLQHLDFAALDRMLGALATAARRVSLIYSGGVTSIEDAVALSRLDLEGAIIGTALYDGRLDLPEAQRAITALA
jgi:phosphoribosylformimino-5-aminoimidazole carboxamide ribotide isomerase